MRQYNIYILSLYAIAIKIKQRPIHNHNHNQTYCKDTISKYDYRKSLNLTKKQTQNQTKRNE